MVVLGAHVLETLTRLWWPGGLVLAPSTTQRLGDVEEWAAGVEAQLRALTEPLDKIVDSLQQLKL